MADMPKEIMDLVNGEGYSYVATASKDGMPNMAIMGSTRAVSPDTIVLAAGFMNKGFKNLQENPKASVIVYSGLPLKKTQASMEDLAKIGGGQIKGSVTLLTSGDIHEKMKSMLAERLGPEIAAMTKATVVLKVEEVYSVGLGPEAGKRIA
jgi:predicted pyridoxine 5'-phosphate oxidase superfamily flavin-nucleotide-binding protein